MQNSIGVQEVREYKWKDCFLLCWSVDSYGLILEDKYLAQINTSNT